ncbi:MAG TPA: tripartite tricarboxylate transporter substrate binding protein [Ramlibacter sp.]|nr:tripartite tricarboxylate transporter substrate binding protein [Ramlibacter sp.]
METTRMPRRRLLAASTSALALLASPGALRAQAGWPAKPVRIVVPYPPGGASDITARLLGQKLAELWGQPVVIDNRAGANGIIALDHTAKQPGDGYTLLMANLGPNAINPAVYAKLPYDALKDFTAITLTTIVPQVVVADPARPQKTWAEVLDFARKNPGKVSYGTGGAGSANHLGIELAGSMAGANLVAVAYKGDGPAMLDVMSGQIWFSYPTVPAAMPHIKSGKLRALAVGSAARVPSLPDVPTMQEVGLAGYESVSWGGIMGPAGMPPDLVQRIHADLSRVLRMPDVQEKLAAQGAQIDVRGPEAFARFVADEIRKWDGVAKKANIRIEQ